MAEVLNLTRLLRKLEKLERDSLRKNNGNVIVGYSASYALYVHENLEAAHGAAYNAKHAEYHEKGKKKGQLVVQRGPNQQAKFLEQPARTMQKELASLIVRAVKGGASLIDALLMAGMRLQRESQKLVPVDTGNLRAGAFTEKE